MEVDELKELFEGLEIENWQKKQLEREQKNLENQELLRAYQFVQEHPAGKIVLWDILSFCGLYVSCFTGNSRTYYNEGRRDVALYLTKMMQFGQSLETIDRIKDLKPDE